MSEVELNLREIMSSTTSFLAKHSENFHFNIKHNLLRERYEVQVLMGRREFEEVYCFDYRKLGNNTYCKFLYQRFGSEIIKNLELNKLMWR